MAQVNPRFRGKKAAASSRIDWAIGKGSMARPGKDQSMGTVDVIEREAELYALAAEVDSAENSFHDAIARRNAARIAYLSEPSIATRAAFEAAKAAEAVALEILDAEIRRLANFRARTVTGIKLKASYASTERNLAESIVEDILQL